METAELTVTLPKEDVEFAERYARAHRITIGELIDRHFRDLRGTTRLEIHPEVEKISGLISREVDARAEHRLHLLEKHG